MSKLGTAAIITAGAALAGYGFYEASGWLADAFNSISSPAATTTVKSLSAAFGAVVGAAGLGTFASKKWIEIRGAILTLVFGAVGAVGGGIGGWELAAHHLPQPGDHSPPAIVQPAAPQRLTQ